jgi:transposase
LRGFFGLLGDRRESIRAVSIDMSGEYQRAIRQAVPNAEICLDPFHVVRLAARATDQVRRVKPPRPLAHARGPLGQAHPLVAAERPTEPDDQPARHARRRPRPQPPLPRLPAARGAAAALPPRESRGGARAPRRLADLGLTLAAGAFVRLARTLRAHRDGILAPIRLGLSNDRLEGLNSKIRLISHRSFGFHSAAALIALVYLCCSGIAIDLP